MNSKNRKTLILVAILAAAVIIAVVVINVVKKGEHAETPAAVETAEQLVDPASEAELSAVYEIDLSGYGQENTFRLMFTDTQFALYLNDDSAANGTYTKNGNEVVLQAEDGKGNQLTNNRMILDGDRLLFEDSMCQGTVPDGETFDAEVSITDGIGTEIRYMFKKDGTYQVYEKGKNTAEEDAITLDGTYKRNGSLIEQTLNGNEILPLYVYRNHVFTSYYTAAKE